MTVCPQCGYERKANDDNFVNAEECPKCGIIYKKWKPSSVSNNTEPILTDNNTSKTDKEKKVTKYKSIFKSIISVVIIIAVLAISAKFTFFERVESTLPNAPVLGMESNSYLIRASGEEGAITAAGQIFSPSHQTPVLLKLGFLFTQFKFIKQAPDSKLQVRLSEWAGDRPAPTALWVSEPRAITPIDTENVQADWIDFTVPYLSLDPKKQYIAWVTLSGLDNPLDANIGIPGMGPRQATLPSDRQTAWGSEKSPYPQGRRALYKQENLDGNVSQMTNSAWETHDVGHNLHFRMSFENNRIVVCGMTLFIKPKNKNDKKDFSTVVVNEQQPQPDPVTQSSNMQQRRDENDQQRIEAERQREETELKRKQQQVEAEIQQYEREQRQNEMTQQQGDRWNREPRHVQRPHRRR